MQNNNDKLCPSYAAKPGAHLFGIVNKEGLISYLNNPIEINEEFVEEAAKAGPPEERFRFTGNCAKSGCSQWDGQNKQCGLIDTLIHIVNNPQTELQPCPIRAQCRWFAQKAGLACAQCNEVIRNFEIRILEAADKT